MPRGVEGLHTLLGKTVTGVVSSDCWLDYSKLPLELRPSRELNGYLFANGQT
jgi:hypothetical protein